MDSKFPCMTRMTTAPVDAQTPILQERWNTCSEFVTLYNPPVRLAGASCADVVPLCQGRLARHAPRAAARFVPQSLHAFLHKPLYPLIDMATADPNRGGHVRDRHAIGHE